MGRRNKVSAIVLVSTFRDVTRGCESVSTKTRALHAKSGTLVMDPASRSETHGSHGLFGQERANIDWLKGLANQMLVPARPKPQLSTCDLSHQECLESPARNANALCERCSGLSPGRASFEIGICLANSSPKSAAGEM